MRRLVKKASSVHLSTFFLKSGDVMGISARMVNWKPWYQVFQEYEAGGVSSFYDGPDQQRAFQMYMDILVAFKGVSEAESFRKRLPEYTKKIQFLNRQPQDEHYHNLLIKKPKFLGQNEW